MIINGFVKISLSLNVNSLETDSVSLNEHHRVIITDPDAFFIDWAASWENGEGELLGATELDVDLQTEEEETQ